MKSQIKGTVLLLGYFVAAIGGPVSADALPAGARAVSGAANFTAAELGDGVATLPVEVSKGQIFVLTDIEVVRTNPSRFVKIFGPDDPDNPRFQGMTQGTSIASYTRSFQTGLVFSAAPSIRVTASCGTTCDRELRVSFSGYVVAAP